MLIVISPCIPLFVHNPESPCRPFLHRYTHLQRNNNRIIADSRNRVFRTPRLQKHLKRFTYVNQCHKKITVGDLKTYYGHLQVTWSVNICSVAVVSSLIKDVMEGMHGALVLTS